VLLRAMSVLGQPLNLSFTNLKDKDLVRKYPGHTESPREGLIRCITQLCRLLDDEKLCAIAKSVLKVSAKVPL
jgi:hypothetical protein